MGIVAATLGSIGSAASSAVGWLGGSTAGFSNAGLLSMGGSLLSSLTGYKSQKEYAKAMQKAEEEQWRQQLINVREQYRQLADQERQMNQEYGESLIQNQISLMRQQAQVELMAAASGTGGASVTSMLNDLAGEAGRNQATIVQNYENQQQGFINQAKAIQQGGQYQMREFKKPSAMSALSSGLLGAANAYIEGSRTGREFASAYQSSRRYSPTMRN